jgi:hypothetical protein
MAVPLPVATGWFICASEGSWGETAACGFADNWLPQRARAIILPSVTTVSPAGIRCGLRVQYTLLPRR